MIARSSSVSLPGLVSTSKRDANLADVATDRRRRSPGSPCRQPSDSASPIASTATFNECVVKVLIELLSFSNGSTIRLSPCIATDSERTTASASSSGTDPPDCTSCCSHLNASASSPRVSSSVVVGSGDVLQLQGFRSAVHAHCAEANAERLHLTRFAGLDRREHQAGENFWRKPSNSARVTPALQLQLLNTGGHEPLAPVPRLQLLQLLLAEDHFVLEK